MVCPYALDVPGGVQNHVRDLTEQLRVLGHRVSVLAPVDEEAGPGASGLPSYVVPAGRAVSVPYNGSVARLAFGPRVAARTHRWLRDGDFEVVHIHEPAVPSVSVLALRAARGPIVGTFHTSNARSRAMSSMSAMLRPLMEKISARIAVSEHARQTLVQHFGGEPVIIPNGIHVDRFAVPAGSRWRAAGGTVVFLGRIDEPRKGLATLLAALPRMLAERPDLHLFVAGRGDVKAARELVTAQLGGRGSSAVTFLGQVDDATRAELMASADLYVAPNVGGESFGIVLVEAMAAGAPVLASDLPAFRGVLEDGRLGTTYPVGDAQALAAEALRLLADDHLRLGLRDVARQAVRRYDWPMLARDIVLVYETVQET
ncbi:MAG TPA: glycosyltransferase family 4 protein [Nocardioidaceae bacterium]|nr:glycosyltransferase family 4 protein [Nocardioidaceae bacterium]